MEINKINLGITGAEGTIGGVLRKGLSNRNEIRSFTFEAVDFESVKVDLSKSEEVEGIFSGLEAVIHLAADPSPEADWDSVRRNNIDATFNVFTECVRAGVKKLVFASTNHTQHGDTLLTTPDTLDPSKNKTLSLDNPSDPDSLYAVSKLFGENLGKYFSEKHGLKYVGLRIGWIGIGDDQTIMRGTPSEDYMRSMFLSHRDCVQAFERAIDLDTRYLIAYAISDNTRKVFDLEKTKKILGFYPVDNSDTYF